MNYQVLDPTRETAPPANSLAPRLSTLAGKTVGFISNGKEGTRGFFIHLEALLHQEFAVGEVIYRTKSNYSAPAEHAIIEEARDWDLTISGLGD